MGSFKANGQNQGPNRRRGSKHSMKRSGFPRVEFLENRQLLSAYYLINAYSGKVLDDPGFSTQDGTLIDQTQWNGGTNQHWKLLPA